MQELVKNGDERWGEKGWQNRTFEKWNEKYPENAFDGVKPNKVMTHIYSFWPDLSYIPENIDLSKIKIKKIFKWLKSKNLSDLEMLKTFNCGVGFCIIINKKNKNKVKKYFTKDYMPYEIGYVSESFKKLNLYNSIKW